MEGEQIIAKTKELKEILDGKNIEEDLISFIKETNREQRENIQRCFDELYPETEGLNKIIEEKFKDNDQKFIKMLFDPRSTTGVQKIIDSFGIFSIDEDPVYELIFNYPKWLKDEIRKKYKQLTEKKLVSSLEDGFSEPIKSNIRLFLKSDRDFTETIDRTKCKKLAELMVKTNPKEWMHNEDIMNQLSVISPNELVLTCRFFKLIANQGIDTYLEYLTPNTKKFIANMLAYMTNPPYKYSEDLRKVLADKNLPIKEKERVLMDIIGNRYDIDLLTINIFYMDKYGDYIEADIKNDMDNNFVSRLLLLLIEESQKINI